MNNKSKIKSTIAYIKFRIQSGFSIRALPLIRDQAVPPLRACFECHWIHFEASQ